MSSVPTVHIPILVSPIVDALMEPFKKLAPASQAHLLVDCTLGGGGHTQALLDALQADPHTRHHKVLAFDQDPSAIARAHKRFEREIFEGKLLIMHSKFSQVGEILTRQFEFNPVLGMMADLGFSSDQLQDVNRGLSFQWDGPLDMRLDPTQGQSAFEFLRRVNETELEKLISEYGEERFSRRIAASIIRHRETKGTFKTTHELRDVIYFAVPPVARHGKIHPATRSFQALRIAVNNELKELETLLSHVILSVKPGGRVAILSFHSLEDRRVKQAFKNRDSVFRQLTKKPIEASEEEIQANPRSRSAKLRIAEREKNEIQL